MKPNNNSKPKDDMPSTSNLMYKLPKKPASEYERKVVSYLKKKYNEQVELEEAVTVKKEKHSWGQMITVHHGSETSYPLHPEHQAAIKKLRPGMKTTFKDETNSTVHASREDDTVHLHRPKTSNKLTSVPYSHFDESVNEAYTEDDIANGGTVIYKHKGQHYMSKVSHKTGGGAATKIHTTSKLGHVVSLNHVVSTDTSDWNRFKNIKEETEQVELGFKSFKKNISEKTLTPAEKKKREEVAKAIERENPNMPMGMKMGIATMTAKRVAESEDMKPIIELSSELLARYKKAASTSASAADAKGDVAKGNKRFSGIMKATKKQFNNDMKTEEVDDEGKMAKGQLMRMVNQASALAQMMEDDKQLDGWVQSKLTMASDYLDSVHDYLMHNKQDVDDMKEGLDEASQFPSKEHAISYAKEKVKSHKDSDDGIEIYSMPGGGARVVHTMNSQGRQQVLKGGGKKVTTVTREQVELDETKGAPKGFHFTRDGKLKRGGANQDGSGGPMLRSDPLDKQRSKVPPVSEDTEGEHLCAKHVYSNMFGEGVVLEGIHADPDEDGNIEWYGVEFKAGIHKVYTEDLIIMHEMMHGNHKKKKRMIGQ